MRGSRTRKEMILHLQKMAKLARGEIDCSVWRLDSFWLPTNVDFTSKVTYGYRTPQHLLRGKS